MRSRVGMVGNLRFLRILPRSIPEPRHKLLEALKGGTHWQGTDRSHRATQYTRQDTHAKAPIILGIQRSFGLAMTSEAIGLDSSMKLHVSWIAECSHLRISNCGAGKALFSVPH